MAVGAFHRGSDRSVLALADIYIRVWRYKEDDARWERGFESRKIYIYGVFAFRVLCALLPIFCWSPFVQIRLFHSRLEGFVGAFVCVCVGEQQVAGARPVRR